MSKEYICDITGQCPYNAEDGATCRFHCGFETNEDSIELPDEDGGDYFDGADETNYNPYMGCDDYECDRDGDGLDF